MANCISVTESSITKQQVKPLHPISSRCVAPKRRRTDLHEDKDAIVNELLGIVETDDEINDDSQSSEEDVPGDLPQSSGSNSAAGDLESEEDLISELLRSNTTDNSGSSRGSVERSSQVKLEESSRRSGERSPQVKMEGSSRGSGERSPQVKLELALRPRRGGPPTAPPPPPSGYVCQFCGQVYDGTGGQLNFRTAFNKHVRRCKEQNDKNLLTIAPIQNGPGYRYEGQPRGYQCRVCGAIYDEYGGQKDFINAFFKHEKRCKDRINKPNLKETRYTCQVPGCGLSYSTQSNLRSHIRQKHLPQPQYDCPECPQKFQYPHVLKRHLEKIHMKPLPVTKRAVRTPAPDREQLFGISYYADTVDD